MSSWGPVQSPIAYPGSAGWGGGVPPGQSPGSGPLGSGRYAPSDYLPKLAQFGIATPTPVNPMDTTGSILPKNVLDGTNAFGANSVPGAYGNNGEFLNTPGDGSGIDSLVSTLASIGRGIKDFWNNAVGTPQNPGWGSTAAGLGNGIFNSVMGMKAYGLAKDTLEFNKQSYAQNYAANKTLTNGQLEDRQRARVASNPGAYQSVGDYMNLHGVK